MDEVLKEKLSKEFSLKLADKLEKKEIGTEESLRMASDFLDALERGDDEKIFQLIKME